MEEPTPPPLVLFVSKNERTWKKEKKEEIFRFLKNCDDETSLKCLKEKKMEFLNQKNLKVQKSSKFSEIVPFKLFISSKDYSKEEIEKFNIATIVNVSYSGDDHDIQNEKIYGKVCSFHKFSFDDSKEEHLSTYFGIIGDLLTKNCEDGISVSPALAMAWLMKWKKWKLYQSFQYVLKKRTCIFPNIGFFRQLYSYQEELEIINEKKGVKNPEFAKKLREKILKEEGIEEKFDYHTFSEIIPKKLYLSGKWFTELTLKSFGIKTIINVAFFKSFNDDERFSEICKIHQFKYNDVASQRLIDDFEYVNDLIVKSEKAVFVHCVHGKSRSSAFVLAYLMKSKRMSFADAFRFVLKKRPMALPNHGFVQQLLEYENTIGVEKTKK